MSRHLSRHHTSRSKGSLGRALRLETLEPRLTLAAFLGLTDAALASYVKALAADGSINRPDMIKILRSVEHQPDGIVNAADLTNLRKIVQNSAALKMPDYVKVLASDVVNGNKANAHYQGAVLGNLAVGSSCVKLGKLTDKWFYGTDLPETEYDHTVTLGTLYSATGPSHLDESQGYLGDCYLIASLGSIADNSKAAIKNMLINNGDGTWTVRFYYKRVADYVTVNRELASEQVGADNALVYDAKGSLCSSTSNVLWIALVEKAYAQWNETGKTGRSDTSNAYAAIEGGWPYDVYRQVLGCTTVCTFTPSTSGAQTTLITALNKHRIANVCTNPNVDSSTKLVGNHVYNVLSYNSKTGKFTLYNPWGSDQPTALTWAQLRANMSTITTVPGVEIYISAACGALAAFRASATATGMSGAAVTAPGASASTAPAAAVDAAIVDWDVPTNDALSTFTVSLQSGKLRLADVAGCDAVKPSDKVVAGIESLFDVAAWHAAAAL
jgi:hypothetical protein